MANVYINSFGVPRISRNKRIYSGVTFRTTNSYEQNNTATDRHFEVAKMTDLTSNIVLVYFKKVFQNSPIPVNIKVYRMEPNAAHTKWFKTDVLHYFADEDWLVKIGFTLVIDPIENLAGVIVEYCFTE